MSKDQSKEKAKDPKPEENLQNQIDELTDALLRERADSVNIRRRHEEQITNLKNLVKADIVRSLLPVVDNFERSLKHVSADLLNEPYVKGIQSVVRQFEKTLESLGVERIKTENEVFDPELHEAVSMEDGEGDTEAISEELQSGYKLGNEVIRHAMVKVRMEPRQQKARSKTQNEKEEPYQGGENE